jgi:hypothetical protein
MRFGVIAVSAVALAALLTTGALMNGACKTDHALWWCAPARAHVSVQPLETVPPKRHGAES